MKPTERFTSRVADYVKYRPSYPPVVFEYLHQHTGLSPAHTIADVGCGTGISCRPFLQMGCTVLGVEPNDAMRTAAVEYLAEFPKFQPVNAAADHTTLADNSVDYIVAAQAFHWFDADAFRNECLRILRPGGWVVLMWNNRRTTQSPFLTEYEALLQQYGLDYDRIQAGGRNVEDSRIASFFAPDKMDVKRFDNGQRFDLEGLKGRLMSSSYVPPKEHANHEPLMDAMCALYDRMQVNGKITMELETVLYCGRLSPRV